MTGDETGLLAGQTAQCLCMYLLHIQTGTFIYVLHSISFMTIRVGKLVPTSSCKILLRLRIIMWV